MSCEADVRTPAVVAGCEWWLITSADTGAKGFFTSEEAARSALQRVGNSGMTWHIWHLVGVKGPAKDEPLAYDERVYQYFAARRKSTG